MNMKKWYTPKILEFQTPLIFVWSQVLDLKYSLMKKVGKRKILNSVFQMGLGKFWI